MTLVCDLLAFGQGRVDSRDARRPGLPGAHVTGRVHIGDDVVVGEQRPPLLEDPLGDADRELHFALQVGPPDGLYAKGDVVTLLYGSTDEVRVLVTQIGRQALEPETVKKIVQATTNTTVVQVEGSPAPALWIEGDAHVLDLPGSPARLARNTLIWTRDGLTLRVEGATNLEQAIRIAESFG